MPSDAPARIESWDSGRTPNPPVADAMREAFRMVLLESMTVYSPLIDVEQIDWLVFARDFAKLSPRRFLYLS